MFPPVRSFRYKYWLKLTITPQATAILKVAAEDTSIVTSNIHGEKKSIPIVKGTDFVINIVGTHYNRTYYLVFSWCLVHILRCYLLQNKITFQLVTGMNRIHSILHVFSKIGLVTPLCLLVLVRNSFFTSESAFFFSSPKCAGSRTCIGRKYVDFTTFQWKHSFFLLFFFFQLLISGSPKLKP